MNYGTLNPSMQRVNPTGLFIFRVPTEDGLANASGTS